MSDSVRPHRRQPTRLPRPWDSPGKKTGVGCLFLLQCMKVKIESEVTQSCLILSDPMDCSPPGSSIHGIFQARVPKWGAIAFSKKTLHHLNLEGKKMYSWIFLSSSFKAVSILKILNCKILIKECFFSLILWLWELTGTALWLYSNSSEINFLPKVIFLIIIFLILMCALGCPKKVYFV